MVGQAQIPFDFVRGRPLARGVERRVFPRFAQGACDCGLGIWDWGFAAAGESRITNEPNLCIFRAKIAGDRRNKACAKVSWCNSAGMNPARPKLADRPE